MVRQIPTPNDPQAELAAIKQATRELHETIQDAKAIRNDLLRAIGSIAPTIDELISQEVITGLTKYQETLDEAISKATQAVYRRFDTLVDIMLGETWKQRKKGLPSITEMFGDIELTDQQKEELDVWRTNEPNRQS
jgi:hypothetical protein